MSLLKQEYVLFYLNTSSVTETLLNQCDLIINSQCLLKCIADGFLSYYIRAFLRIENVAYFVINRCYCAMKLCN